MLAGLAAAFGLFPVFYIVITTLFLYNITVKGGQFEIIRASLAGVTGDRRIQALLIAFSFGAFFEGAAGFGTPVAVTARLEAHAVNGGIHFRHAYNLLDLLSQKAVETLKGQVGYILMFNEETGNLKIGGAAGIHQFCRIGEGAMLGGMGKFVKPGDKVTVSGS